MKYKGKYYQNYSVTGENWASFSINKRNIEIYRKTISKYNEQSFFSKL